MKILVVHNDYQSKQIGGEDIVVANEISALKNSLGDGNVLEYRVSNDTVNSLKLLFTLWGNQTHHDNIKALVLKHQIDIVHVHNFFPLLTPLVFVAAKQAGAKVIHTLHNYRWWCPSGILYRPHSPVCEQCVQKKFAYPAIIHRCYRGSGLQSLGASLAFLWYRLKQYDKHIDAYFVLTPFQQEKVKTFGLTSRVWLKPNAVALPRQDTLVPINQKKDYVFVGRLESAKGIAVLLETWAKLPHHFQLDIIGDGVDGEHLRQTYQAPHIRFLGKLPHTQVLAKIGAAKYLLQPSLWYETFGLTIVEALSRGTPVIGFDKGTRPDFIQSQVNGFLCQEGDLQKTLESSWHYSDYAKMSQQAIESAKMFDVPAIMTKQIALYQQIMAGQS